MFIMSCWNRVKQLLRTCSTSINPFESGIGTKTLVSKRECPIKLLHDNTRSHVASKKDVIMNLD